jgi:signal transduction histidine kinase
MAEEVETAQRTLKRYLGLVTTGQEDERKRLARELHDDTLQSLIALNQRVMMVRRSTKNIGFDESLAEIEEMITQTMAELRRLTRALRPIYLEDLGLVTALHTMTQEMSQSSSIQINFQFEGEEKRLTDNIEIALFRISQEALSNILRHSEATEAAVNIDFRQTEVLLKISDNGKGFIPPSNPGLLSNLGHFGLLGIYERAELIGASISVDSEIDQGTTIRLAIPI